MNIKLNSYKSDKEILLTDDDNPIKLSITLDKLKSIIMGFPLEKKLEFVDMFFHYRCDDDKDFIEHFCNDQIERSEKNEQSFLQMSQNPYWIEWDRKYNNNVNQYKLVSERYGRDSIIWKEFRDKILKNKNS